MKNEFEIGEAINLYLQQNGIKEKALVQTVIDDWAKLMGKPIADNTEKVWFAKGVFYVKMNDPVWKNELSMAKTKIKDTLNGALGAGLVTEVKIL